MKTNPIGAHFSIHNGYLGALLDALAIGADCLQIFSKSPMSAKFRSVTKEESLQIKNWESRDKIKNIIIHASYLLNFAKPAESNSFPIKSLAEDLQNAVLLGTDGVVLHMGKYLEYSQDEAKKNFIENIKKTIELVKDTKSKIFIENTAGQGTEFGFSLEEIKKIKNELGNENKIGFCIDTAHAWGAGYDIKTPAGAENFANDLNRNIGIKNIGCIHLNDSKKLLGSKVDRHEDLGVGEIGEKGLKSFVLTINKLGGENIPLILETPQGKKTYKEQIKTVRNWFI